jgi:hypothetical protein
MHCTGIVSEIGYVSQTQQQMEAEDEGDNKCMVCQV